MPIRLHVAHRDALPPGKGAVVRLGDWEIMVFNVAGRYHASARRPAHVGTPALVPPGAEPPCLPSGHIVEASSEDVPARGTGRTLRLEPRLEGEHVVLDVDEGPAL